MEKTKIENWLSNLKKYWFQKDPEKAASLFQKTSLYQETPFSLPFTTFEEIQREWQHIKDQEIKEIRFHLLAIEDNTAIVEWNFKRDIHEFDGIYEIKFNKNYECISFRSWEMEKQ